MLILVRGYPGQGKTQFAHTYCNWCPVFENDQFFYENGKYQYDRSKMKDAIDWCYSSVENCLKRGIDCCVANTFTKVRFVEFYRMLAEKYNAEFKVLRMRGEFKNIHDVPEDILKNMKDTFEDYDGEMYVYPNINQSKDDSAFRPYMFTNLKIGDNIKVAKFKNPIDLRSFEIEECIATVNDISQGTYDYLNIHYIECDTQKRGICMSGDCKKIY